MCSGVIMRSRISAAPIPVIFLLTLLTLLTDLPWPIPVLTLLTDLPWPIPVIFLRTTHAELTRAGYTELDPLHELFMLYREKEDEQLIHDMSILSPRYLSPRYTARGQQDVVASPRAGALDRTERYVEVGSTPLKVRQGVALTSKFIGLVSQGTRLRVLDSRIWRRDGTRRVCVASTESEESQAPAILPLGWVTASKLTPAGKPPPAPSPASSSPPYLNPMEC